MKTKFSVGDRVAIVNSAIIGTGNISEITEGGEKLGFPWKDKTPHYAIEDEKTGFLVIAHEKNVELCK